MKPNQIKLYLPVLALNFIAVGLLTGMSASDRSAPTSAPVISNHQPRLDVEGRIVDAHDGCLQKFGDRYYLYGTAYGNTDGFNKNNRYRCYSSADLVTWKLEGELLQNPPEGVYYRPYVVFNAKTRKYVLWYNWYATLWIGQYGVATSDTPQGPFVIQNPNVAVKWQRPGDHNLMVDDDGLAYLIYTSIEKKHSLSIEKLSPDYLSSTLESSGFLAEGCEATALFKRQNRYYALFDKTCCFCPEGTGARVYVADKPLGPYTLRGNINRDASGKPIIPAQQTYVAQLPTPRGLVYLWMGDRWGSRPDGIKGHDFQYWSRPLEFTEDGNIRPLQRDVSIGDKDFVIPPVPLASVPRLSPEIITIESARYGDLDGNDPARVRDVKAKVEKALRTGDGRFSVSSLAAGDDPAYGVVKTLKVVYRVEGRPVIYVGKDSDTADFLEAKAP